MLDGGPLERGRETDGGRGRAGRIVEAGLVSTGEIPREKFVYWVKLLEVATALAQTGARNYRRPLESSIAYSMFQYYSDFKLKK